MIYKATVLLYLNVNNDSECADAVSAILTDQLRKFVPTSCLMDWEYFSRSEYPSRPMTKAEVETAKTHSMDWPDEEDTVETNNTEAADARAFFGIADEDWNATPLAVQTTLMRAAFEGNKTEDWNQK